MVTTGINQNSPNPIFFIALAIAPKFLSPWGSTTTMAIFSKSVSSKSSKLSFKFASDNGGNFQHTLQLSITIHKIMSEASPSLILSSDIIGTGIENSLHTTLKWLFLLMTTTKNIGKYKSKFTTDKKYLKNQINPQ